MSMLFGGGASPPPPPPPPPAAPQLASPTIMQAGAAERETLATAGGLGMSGTNVTGGQGVKTPSTTKALLGE